MLGTCRQIAVGASYQCTSRSKNTLQMTSFCAPTLAPFLQPSALLHLQSKMNLPPARQSSALLLHLNVAVRKISGRLGSCSAVFVLFFQTPLQGLGCCWLEAGKLWHFLSFVATSAVLVQDVPVWNGTITWPVVLLLVAFSRTILTPKLLTE